MTDTAWLHRVWPDYRAAGLRFDPDVAACSTFTVPLVGSTGSPLTHARMWSRLRRPSGAIILKANVFALSRGVNVTVSCANPTTSPVRLYG